MSDALSDEKSKHPPVSPHGKRPLGADRKRTSERRISVRLPKLLAEELRERAEREGFSLSTYTRRLLLLAMEEESLQHEITELRASLVRAFATLLANLRANISDERARGLFASILLGGGGSGDDVD